MCILELSFYLLWDTPKQIFMFNFRVYKRASQSPIKFKGALDGNEYIQAKEH